MTVCALCFKDVTDFVQSYQGLDTCLLCRYEIERKQFPKKYAYQDALSKIQDTCLELQMYKCNDHRCLDNCLHMYNIVQMFEQFKNMDKE